MTSRVFVTGVGIVAAIGRNCDEVMQSIESRRTGLGRLSLFESEHSDTIPVCEVALSNGELSERSGTTAAIQSRTTLLGLTAAREAIQNAGVVNPSQKRTGLISANSVGGMDLSEQFFEAVWGRAEKGRLRQVVEHDAGSSTRAIARALDIRDFVTTISTACSSSANSIMLAARMIRGNILDCALAGGCDALTRFTLNGFFSLKILDSRGCRPFDAGRAGLNLGEGAGFLVLESERSVERGHKEPICEVRGWANTCDAYHQTASSPEGDGPFLAMREALATAGLKPADIDYINAHGTGTLNNDLSEGKAIQRLFDKTMPGISSTKPFTGHTLGAAGGIEAVLSCLAIANDWIYPSLGFKTPIAGLQLIPETGLVKEADIQHVMSNSFGFGGNNSSLIFSRC